MDDTLSECSMYDLNVFTKPQIHSLMYARLFWLVINMWGIWQVEYNLHSVVFAGFLWTSLLYCCGDISYQVICLCVVNHSRQIYLSYSKNCWVFHPPYLDGFPRVYLVSCGDCFMWLNYSWRFIYCWYKEWYVEDLETHRWMI